MYITDLGIKMPSYNFSLQFDFDSFNNETPSKSQRLIDYKCDFRAVLGSAGTYIPSTSRKWMRLDTNGLINQKLLQYSQ